ncbi:IclR family transcriptional regulator [Bradyrhizobium sp. NP1]|uniref:IclR family transcriptional regulator n=1 Tax=Bradyrhizobium sp. NP1 TaxID=3049772 RepID=UPI0025A63EF3|nr:IclR family transcriptional regulator [Bradyrhizobium sp. NP1]WJR75811.1 IclR family transcriptional regulator [Bradyrhizobium sp. NP1]
MDQTSVKAFRLLETLVAAGAPRGVSDLARETGLPKSNVHRVVTTLEALGYVRKTAEGSYAVTLKLWELGTAVMSRVDIRQVASPHMRALVDATGESAILAILDGLDVVYVDKIESDQAIQAMTRVGSRVPAHCVGTGKAMLAFQPAGIEAEIARRVGPRTSATIHEEAALRREFEAIRKRGYAINRGEFRDQVAGVAAPILNSVGGVIAGVGVWGPDQRLAKKLPQLGAAVVVCAEKISAEFGRRSAPEAPVQPSRPNKTSKQDK